MIINVLSSTALRVTGTAAFTASKVIAKSAIGGGTLGALPEARLRAAVARTTGSALMVRLENISEGMSWG